MSGSNHTYPIRAVTIAKPLLFVVCSAAFGALFALTLRGNAAAAAAIALAAAAVLALPRLLEWRLMVLVLLIVLFCVPARLYALPVSLPFEIDLFRLVVLAFLGVWAVALLTDPEVRLQKTRLDGPMLMLGVVATTSFVANLQSFEPVDEFPMALKALFYLIAMLLLFRAVASVVRGPEDATQILRAVVLVAAGTAVMGVLEFATGENAFRSLDSVLPFLQPLDVAALLETEVRNGNLRIAGSANHPIAYGTLLAMVLPLCLHFWLTARTVKRRLTYAIAAGLIGIAILLTGSRTGVIGLVVGLGMMALLKPEWRRGLAVVAVILTLVVHMLVPGLVGQMARIINPTWIVQNERGSIEEGGGRLEDYPVMLAEFGRRPLIGRSIGTYDPDRFIYVDNEYLLILVELGLSGVAAFLWLFYRSVSWFVRAGSSVPQTERGLLYALAASALIFAIATATFDTLGFPQVTYFFFFLLALGAVLASEVEQRVLRGKAVEHAIA